MAFKTFNLIFYNFFLIILALFLNETMVGSADSKHVDEMLNLFPATSAESNGDPTMDDMKAFYNDLTEENQKAIKSACKKHGKEKVKNAFLTYYKNVETSIDMLLQREGLPTNVVNLSNYHLLKDEDENFKESPLCTSFELIKDYCTQMPLKVKKATGDLVLMMSPHGADSSDENQNQFTSEDLGQKIREAYNEKDKEFLKSFDIKVGDETLSAFDAVDSNFHYSLCRYMDMEAQKETEKNSNDSNVDNNENNVSDDKNDINGNGENNNDGKLIIGNKKIEGTDGRNDEVNNSFENNSKLMQVPAGGDMAYLLANGMCESSDHVNLDVYSRSPLGHIVFYQDVAKRIDIMWESARASLKPQFEKNWQIASRKGYYNDCEQQFLNVLLKMDIKEALNASNETVSQMGTQLVSKISPSASKNSNDLEQLPVSLTDKPTTGVQSFQLPIPAWIGIATAVAILIGSLLIYKFRYKKSDKNQRRLKKDVFLEEN